MKGVTQTAATYLWLQTVLISTACNDRYWRKKQRKLQSRESGCTVYLVTTHVRCPMLDRIAGRARTPSTSEAAANQYNHSKANHAISTGHGGTARVHACLPKSVRSITHRAPMADTGTCVRSHSKSPTQVVSLLASWSGASGRDRAQPIEAERD